MVGLAILCNFDLRFGLVKLKTWCRLPASCFKLQPRGYKLISKNEFCRKLLFQLAVLQQVSLRSRAVGFPAREGRDFGSRASLEAVSCHRLQPITFKPDHVF